MRKLALAPLVLALACARAAPRPETAPGTLPNEVDLAFAEAGAGPPILLIHGGWGDLRSFSRAIPALSAAHHVVAPSLRYHWPNPWPAPDTEAYRSYTVESHAADLVALLERLALGPVDVIGHSYGAAVAAHLARSRPELVRRLVLVEAAVASLLRETPEGQRVLADRQEPRPGWLARLRAGEDPLSVLRTIIDGNDRGRFDRLSAAQRRIFVANARTTGPAVAHPAEELLFTCEDARRLGTPILLLEGEKTARQYHEMIARFAACAPAARHVVVPGSGHSMPFDAPEAMAHEVVSFLRGD